MKRNFKSNAVIFNRLINNSKEVSGLGTHVPLFPSRYWIIFVNNEPGIDLFNNSVQLNFIDFALNISIYSVAYQENKDYPFIPTDFRFYTYFKHLIADKKDL